MNAGKKIILGVTGSIAAHKAADLASMLTKAKCDVRVVMTADAQRFITALPFKTLTRNPVVTNLYDEDEGWKPTHIELADAADLLIIAPATANVIAKLAHGIADDALSCIALALNPRARILMAPAMNGKMWLHPATQANVRPSRSGVSPSSGRMRGCCPVGTRALAVSGRWTRLRGARRLKCEPAVACVAPLPHEYLQLGTG